MTNRLEYMLREWGQWVERHLEWHNEYGENILYRAGFMAGRGGRPGHKILTPECPKSVRRIDKQVRRLSEKEMSAIFYWYCAPVNAETGKPFTKRQLANVLGMSYHAFDKRLTRGRKRLRKRLTTV